MKTTMTHHRKQSAATILTAYGSGFIFFLLWFGFLAAKLLVFLRHN